MNHFRSKALSFSATLGVIALANLGVSAIAAPNLVQNGSFEINGGQGFIDWQGSNPYHRKTTLANWVNNQENGLPGYNVVTSIAWLQSQNYYVPNLWGVSYGYQNGNGFTASPDGGWFVQSDGFDGNSPLEQTIGGLSVGSTYTLSFQYAHAQEGGVNGDSVQYFEVSFGDETFSTTPVYLPQHQFRGWYNASKQFTATSSSQLLRFLAHGTSSVPPYLLLDGVTLTADPTPPGPSPVPGPVPVLGIAGSLLWSRKLRRRIQRNSV